MVMVSHDRTLLATCCEKFMLVAEGKAEVFDGDLEDYKQHLLKVAQTAPTQTNEAPAKQNNYHQQKAERQARLVERRPLLKALSSLEAQLAKLETEKQALESRLADNEIYSPAQKSSLQSLLISQADNRKQLEQVEGEWLALQEKLEALPE